MLLFTFMSIFSKEVKEVAESIFVFSESLLLNVLLLI
jgi:hypothetical protein